MISRRTLLRVFAALSFLLLPASAFAQACSGGNVLQTMAESDPERLARIEADAARVVNAEGVLWRIAKPGIAPSYLFGTIHLTDERMRQLPAPVEEALAQSSRVIVENTDVLDPAAAATAMAAHASLVSFTDGDRLSAYLDADSKEMLSGMLGGSLAPVEQMRPWTLAVALAIPACEAARRADHDVVDGVVANYAKNKGLELIGLESVAEQLSAFNGVPLKLQAEFLTSTMRLFDARDDMFATMGELYLQRRIAMIDAVSRDMSFRTGISAEAYDAFTRELLLLRNDRMAERAAPHVAKGGSFIAVGALHLPDQTGLVEQFRRRGFEVTRVY